jgi:hypothetical protein
MLTAKEIKDFAEAHWNDKGVIHAANCNVFTEQNGSIRIQAGATRNYVSKEARKWRSQFAMYNEKLRPLILAEATATPRNVEVPVLNEYGRPVRNGNRTQTEVKQLKEYRWPKADPKPAAPVKETRKRVSRKRVEQAAAILAKVPESELTAFLSRFGLTLSAAAAIASTGDIEAMAREFLRVSL